ncbi:hypothetical protein XELAEV_18040230mg [Xenopus laevis]|uniref:G-protein coupled receptors family 3 profile domain-containing protein n=1 Tax=Xenopus laevis TaxID=8355 RepID=A0A974C9P6_XENLA|nr:hypothetical protein XELAEV_18040230mg [Xenopus laevis]
MKATAWLAVTWMLGAMTSTAMKISNSSACSLNRGYEEGYLQEGDIMLGILLDIFVLMNDRQETFKEQPLGLFFVLSSSSLQYYIHFLAAIFAIEEINNNLSILPNVTLGFHIHDSWANERKAISSIFSMLTGSSDYVPNYRCTQNRIPSAFIGHLLSSVSNVMYQITSIYGFPQVSYGAIDSAFGDRVHFPLFYRTVTSETAQYKVIIQLFKLFRWNWVGMIFSDDESHQKASEDMKNEIKKNGICVDYLVQIGEKNPRNYDFALQTIRQSNASVVIVYSRVNIFMEFLVTVAIDTSSVNVVWIMLSPLSLVSGNFFTYAFNGSLVVLFHHENIPGLKDFLYKANPLEFPKDPFTNAVWLRLFHCHSSPEKSFKFYHICNANNTLKQYESYGYDVNNFRLTYTMYIAIYSVAHALHAMFTGKANDTNKVTGGLLLKQIPVSSCSASCPSGYRKAFVEGKQVCCYDCVQCSEGEISPSPDMENCLRCPEDQWSNESRDKCIMRTVDFLSYKEPLGVALTTTALVLSFCSAAVFCIFLKYKKSPIVKANNQELSYILLFSLMLSFLCSLLFIGRPTKVTCLLRQTSFGINFVICISSILGKTITVIIAFNAKRPGSRLRNYVGTRVPKYILLLCTLPMIFICAFWMIISPPFSVGLGRRDTGKKPGKIILQCNEGSSCAFYIMVGYIALLAFVSFFVAYLVRKLPDIYNEAQYITFSMLLFCSVWISFILVYVSTTSKYLAVVEIFAILVSSAGILFFIFIPKCCIIFFKPPVSTRGHLI